MCGICGQFYFQSGRITDKSLLRRMTDSIVHRGPDDEGFYQSKSYSAGFRRLSIIDLAGGHQPMCDSEERYWLTFNGEIYNFKELKKELEALGHRFRTNSDTEVIIYGYKAWGDRVLDKLNGMFGFALWDNLEERLLVARDPLGLKSLYYSVDRDSLVFGSEIRPVQIGLGREKEISHNGLRLFLKYRYTPAPLTIFENIKKLAPGTCLVADRRGVEVKRWWNYKPVLEKNLKRSDIVEKLQWLYKQAMERQLISDVPLGLLLSGGMDSAMLLSLMNSFGSGWNTFTVGFGQAYKDDELADAKITSQFFGSHHHDIRISRDEFEKSLPRVIEFLEEPVATASIVPMFHVCQKASEFVKVALVGQGPDELFGGYSRHVGLNWGGVWRNIPSFIRKPLKKMMKNFSSRELIGRALYSLDVDDQFKRYQNVFSIVEESQINQLFHPDQLEMACKDDLFSCWGDLLSVMSNLDEVGGFQFFELRSSLPDELLMYSDKLSMAHGLELRVPFLDKEIVQFVETIPDSQRNDLFQRKKLHKQVANSFLPPSIIHRKKRAFSINVVEKWFSDSFDGKIKSYFQDEQSLMYSYLDKNSVSSLLTKHQTGAGNYYKILFSLVVFEEWLRLNN